jgi:hypothetical protein
MTTLTSTTDQILRNTLSAWTTQGRAFTAFEVSLEARNQGCTERHREMKDLIHEVMDYILSFGGYRQTIVPVGTENGQRLEAILYHPKNFAPSQYQPLQRGRSRPATPSPQPVGSFTFVVTPPTPSISIVTPTSTASKNSVTKKVDNRACLLIPSQFIQEAGFKPSEEVYVCTDGSDTLLVTKHFSPGRTCIGTYTVDHGNNVRITQHCLSKGGVGGTLYEVTGGSEVKIKRVG